MGKYRICVYWTQQIVAWNATDQNVIAAFFFKFYSFFFFFGGINVSSFIFSDNLPMLRSTIIFQAEQKSNHFKCVYCPISSAMSSVNLSEDEEK